MVTGKRALEYDINLVILERFKIISSKSSFEKYMLFNSIIVLKGSGTKTMG